MATLSLTKLWINRLDDGTAVSAQTAVGRAGSVGADGEIREYAGGRQRAFTRAGRRGAFDATLRQVPSATVAVLESWIGVPVQVRDYRGQVFRGVFFEVPRVEVRDNIDLYDVPLAFRAVTVVGV